MINDIAVYNNHINGNGKFVKGLLINATEYFYERDWAIVPPYALSETDKKQALKCFKKESIF